MPSNFTANYNLSQWERTDQVRMEDFNADNAKIDAAIKAETDARTALAAEVAKRGNCQICRTTYVGTGEWDTTYTTSVTFPWPPDLVIVVSWEGSFLLMSRGMSRSAYHSNNRGGITMTWSGNTLSWHGPENANYQMNSKNNTYHVYAFRILS